LGFLEYIKPTPAEAAANEEVTRNVRDTLRKYAPHLDTEVFGSQASGLALATSDIDIRIFEEKDKDLVEAPRVHSRKTMKAHLVKIKQQLQHKNKDFIMVQMRHARYPLISMMHKKSRLDVQVVANNNTLKSQLLIKEYLDRYPDLYAVFTLVKTMLEIRGLTDVYRGGLGSYSLFMMLVPALEKKSAPSSLKGEENAAALMLRWFLKLYTHLNTYKTAVLVQPPYSINKHTDDSVFPQELKSQLEERPVRRNLNCMIDFIADDEQYLHGLHQLALIDRMQPYLLCLQDPADPLNDLGRKGYGWKHIQVTLKTLSTVIHQRMADSDRGKFQGSLIGQAVGPCFEAYKARRALTEAFGQQILDAEQAKRETEEKAAEQKAVEAETADV
jgi:non-canonical poly(A) RNA polymerase PAPD5/7